MQGTLTIYYSPDDVTAFDGGLRFFEDLRKELGTQGAIEFILENGGEYYTTDDMAWIAMSHGIRSRGIETGKMSLKVWHEGKWVPNEFDVDGDLIYPIPANGDHRFKLLFD